MAVNITNRADAEAIIREQVVSQYFSGRTEKFRIYGNGKKTSKHDI